MLLSEATRPKKLQDVIGQDSIIHTLREYMKDPWKAPHMIFSGPPGCGKTSAIGAYSREVYGPDFDRSVKMMNLSGERSVQTIIKKVHSVCRYYHERKGTKGLFICDEADCMTSEAQDIMVHCVKLYEKRWTFVFIMNRLSDLSPMLAELCEIHQFMPIQDPDSLLRKVLPENMREHTITNIKKYYSGDLRRILNATQGFDFVDDEMRPEWEHQEWETKYDRLTMLRVLRDGIENHCKEMPMNVLKECMEIAIGLHRPGNLEPYIYAFEYAINTYPNFFPLVQDEHHTSRRGKA